ncbi:MAG: DUF2442 domain-containing protein [Acidobacteriota bacterium]
MRETITAELLDGRSISVPLTWSWRLSEATPIQRDRFEILGNGEGVRWPDIDEDISAEGMLSGVPARRSVMRQKEWAIWSSSPRTLSRPLHRARVNRTKH